MIGAADYAFLGNLLRETIGLSIGHGKEYLVESRLRPIATSFGCATVADLVGRLRDHPAEHARRAVCEAMATYESSFFRDGTPFEVLANTILPELVRKRHVSRSLRIWSAAASTGQEAYSLAMLVDDLAAHDWHIDIVATDFSRWALDRARAARYTAFELQRGLTLDQRLRFFVKDGSQWEVRESTRQRVHFREQNLLHPFQHLGGFDLILCRNVLIYFDLPTRSDVLDRMAAAIAPGGYLMLGAAETALGVTDRFHRLTQFPASIYRKREPPTEW